jgi:uncharacterized protein YajQ (UPF0234 family)
VNAYIDKEVSSRFDKRVEKEIEYRTSKELRRITDSMEQYKELRGVLRVLCMSLLGYNDPAEAMKELRKYEAVYDWVIENKKKITDFKGILDKLSGPEF